MPKLAFNFYEMDLWKISCGRPCSLLHLYQVNKNVRPSAFACKLCVKNKINFFFPILNAHWTGMDYTNALVPCKV